MILKEYLTKEELYLLDEELFHECYYAILEGVWPEHTFQENRQLAKLDNLQKRRYALETASKFLQNLPQWPLESYFSRYGSRHLNQIRRPKEVQKLPHQRKS